MPSSTGLTCQKCQHHNTIPQLAEALGKIFCFPENAWMSLTPHIYQCAYYEPLASSNQPSDGMNKATADGKQDELR